jgi:hypothetical protein
LIEEVPAMSSLLTQGVKTPVAARILAVPYHCLIGLLRDGKMIPPSKDSSGDYLWAEEDLAAARQALARRQQRRSRA